MNYNVSFKYVATLFLKSLIPSLHAQQRFPRVVEENEKNFLEVLKVDHKR